MSPKLRENVWRTVAAVVLVAAVTWLCFTWLPVNSTTIALIYLLAVLAIAASWGLVASSVASVLAMFCFNYFFLPPVKTFTVADPQNWVALFAFLVTAIVASSLSDRASTRAAEAIQRQQEMERLYELSRALLLTSNDQSVAAQLAAQVARIFSCEEVAFYDRATSRIHRAGPSEIVISEARLRDAASQRTEFQSEGTTTLPVSLGGHGIGSLAIRGGKLSEAAQHAIANLAAIALEKELAQAAASRSEAARHNEELKATLLDAVAHEFKTPLTSIKAAATSMLSGAPQSQSSASTRELLTVIDEETDRLSEMVTEAIQMARIEAGKLRLEKKPVAIADLIAQLLHEFSTALDGRKVEVEVAPGTPLVEADPELVALVVRQILRNAIKYSPPGSPLRIGVSTAADGVQVSVADQGCGIPEHEQVHIFDKFYRAHDVRESVPGTGMGLTIAREIVNAHNGRIWVQSRPRQGSEFFFTLPAVRENVLA